MNIYLHSKKILVDLVSLMKNLVKNYIYYFLSELYK